MSNLPFKIQLAKGHKDSNVGVDWAVAQCVDPVMEAKYDGWRMIAMVQESGVRMIAGRNGKDYTGQVPAIEAELAQLPLGTIVDGELVALSLSSDGRWCQNFTTVQTAMTTKLDGKKAGIQQEAAQKLRFIAFDLIQLGENPTVADRPQRDRRAVLIAALELHELNTRVGPSLQMEATHDNHEALLAMGMEGSVIKDQAKPYAFGKRGHGWFKLKGTTTLDVVVTELPVDGKGQFAEQVGRMVVGQYRDGALVERTRVNAPNNRERLEMTAMPDKFVGRVAEIKVYSFDPKTGSPRHPTFLRWRSDKLPQECLWTDA